LTLKRHQPPDCEESEAQPHDRRLAVSIRAPQSRTMTVAKLRGARDRKRATGVKVEGRLSHAQERPDVVAMAKSLHALRLSLRAIAERLEAAGHANSNGRRFAAVSVRNCQRGDRMKRREFIAGLGGWMASETAKLSAVLRWPHMQCAVSSAGARRPAAGVVKSIKPRSRRAWPR
jgi:hypothetical protein